MSGRRLNKEELLAELKLVEAAKVNPRHFGVLYERYYRQIFLFVYKRVDNEDICGDITSQVFLKAMVNLKKYTFKGVPFSAWLYRVASNEVNMFFRSTKASRTISMDKSDIERLMESTKENESLDLKEHFQDSLLEVLDGLKEEELQIIELRFFEKRSFKEVAYILGIQENNAKVKVHRIIGRLRKKMLDKAGGRNE